MHPYRIDIITQHDQHTGMDDHGRQRKIVYPVKQQMDIIGCQDLTKNQGQRPCQNKTQDKMQCQDIQHKTTDAFLMAENK